MKTVRKKQFETNSSSTHSIVVDTATTQPSIIVPKVYGGEFGWEWNKFNQFERKASYMWTLALNWDESNLREKLERLGEQNGVEFVVPSENDWCYCDHGYEHYTKFVEKYPEIEQEDGLWEFLTNSKYWIYLGNDNEGAPPNFELTEQQLKECKQYLVISLIADTKFYIHPSIGLEEFIRDRVYYCCDRGSDYNRYCDCVVVDMDKGEAQYTMVQYNYQEKKYTKESKTTTFTIHDIE
jgi:hypothetical protein